MYVVHPDWLRPRNRGVLINCEGFTQVDVASSLEVLFFHPGVVSLTGGDAQGAPQVAELRDLLKEVTDKSIRPTEEFEGQNKSIKSRMRYLPWKHKVLKMSTREQCQYNLFAEVLSGGKKAEYFERLRWECPLRYEEGLSIFAGLPSTLKKWSVVSGKLMLRVKITDSFIQGDSALAVGKVLPPRFSNKQSYRGSGSRDLETMPLRFLRNQSCWGSGSRDSESGVSSIFEKVIMLGVWLSRFGGWCLFDFGASNLVGSVFSNVSKGWVCLLVYLATKHRG
ncbi:hypothetical protein ACFX14_005938 [Malus domestica]